jgi:YVTN family beta-propeller protein
MVDLNSHYLLVMNDEPSISVIDPRAGITGRTNMLTRVRLRAPGGDWTKTRDDRRLFVTMPLAGRVAAIDTDSFKVITDVEAGMSPLRAVLQADGKYLWVGNDSPDTAKSGVTVIDAEGMTVASRILTGKGHHEIALSGDDRFAFVSNRDEGTVSVIDVPSLKKLRDIATGQPLALAYSPLSRAIYVVDGSDGVISVIDGDRQELIARIQVKPGLGPVRFTPDGRWGFAVNSIENAVHVIDAATNKLTYTVPVGGVPYEILFTRAFAHVRCHASERVYMINLSALGKESMQAPNNYPAGATPPDKVPGFGVASGVVGAVGEAATYVLSPADKAIYYYMEGMNAPSGSFQTYGQVARAISIVNRSLREREPGVYSTNVKLPVAGRYDVAFLLDSPRLVDCMSVTVQPNPAIQRKGPTLRIEHLGDTLRAAAGSETTVSFLLRNAAGEPATALKDVQVMFYMMPGLHRTEVPATEIGDGKYEAVVTPPEAGAYYIYVSCPSAGVRYSLLPYRTLIATSPAETAQEARP